MENFDSINDASKIINWKNINKDNILYYIMLIQSQVKFQSIINLLFKSDKERKINIFSNLNSYNDTILHDLEGVSIENVAYVVNLFYKHQWYNQILTKKNNDKKTFYEANKNIICPLLKINETYSFIQGYKNSCKRISEAK